MWRHITGTCFLSRAWSAAGWECCGHRLVLEWAPQEAHTVLQQSETETGAGAGPAGQRQQNWLVAEEKRAQGKKQEPHPGKVLLLVPQSENRQRPSGSFPGNLKKTTKDINSLYRGLILY